MSVLSSSKHSMSVIKLSGPHPHLSYVLEWAGCVVSLVGAALLAVNVNVSSLGWVAFLAANLLMIWFALRIRRYGLLVQQLGFMATSLVGIWRADFTGVQLLVASIGAGLHG